MTDFDGLTCARVASGRTPHKGGYRHVRLACRHGVAASARRGRCRVHDQVASGTRGHRWHELCGQPGRERRWYDRWVLLSHQADQVPFRRGDRCQNSYVVKAWPEFEILPKENIRDMFVKDIKAYTFPAADFYPRPNVVLADFDADNDQWALVMEDVATFAVQKLHENELTLDEVMQMVPRTGRCGRGLGGLRRGTQGRSARRVGC